MIGKMIFKKGIFILTIAAFACVSACQASSLPAELEKMPTRDRSDKELASGVSYHFRHFDNPFKDGPVAVHFLVIDWKKTPKGFSLGLTSAGSKRRKPSEMGAERNALAAVNGGFHERQDPPIPFYTIKIDGVVTDGSHPGGDTSFAFNPGEMPVIEKYSPALLAKYENLISGDGVTAFYDDSPKPTKEERQKDRDAQTFIGQDSKNRITVIIVADTDRKDSIGVTYTEECALAMPFGCQKVVSIDGGGSSVMALRNTSNKMKVVNVPIQDLKIFKARSERPVADALLLLDKDSKHILPPKAPPNPRPLVLSLCSNL